MKKLLVLTVFVALFLAETGCGATENGMNFPAMEPKSAAVSPTAAPAKATSVPPTPLPAIKATPTIGKSAAAQPTKTKVEPTATTVVSPLFLPFGKVAFVSTEKGNPDIYLFKSGETKLVNLTNHAASDSDPVFSPDGQKIAFVSNRTGNLEIYVMNSDGSNLKQLTNTGKNTDTGKNTENGTPSWFPDGSRIVFHYNTGNRSDSKRLFTIDADGKNRRQIVVNPEGLTEKKYELEHYDYGNAAVSPDGKKIVFSISFPGQSMSLSQIYIINIDGAGIGLLMGENSPDCPSGGKRTSSCGYWYYQNPSWWANGEKVAANGRYPYYGVYSTNLDRTGLETLYKGKFEDFRFSPDEKWVIGSTSEILISALEIGAKETKPAIASRKSAIHISEPTWAR